MSATTCAVLHAGATPTFIDIDPRQWTMDLAGAARRTPERVSDLAASMPVSLFGLHARDGDGRTVDDAAQTLRPHATAAFTSYSFQASKILALSEGGMLVTNDDGLATRAREFSSLGYRMDPRQPRIDPATLKTPDFARHLSVGFNYRMSDLVAREGLARLPLLERAIVDRRHCAELYRQAVADCGWIMTQRVGPADVHDYWCFGAALDSPSRWHPFVEAIVRYGGERPYAAWRLTYQEPAFRALAPDGSCPVAEDLQPRLLQFQTNDLPSAERNARAVAAAIRELGA
jgi:perosamine synthetase